MCTSTSSASWTLHFHRLHSSFVLCTPEIKRLHSLWRTFYSNKKRNTRSAFLFCAALFITEWFVGQHWRAKFQKVTWQIVEIRASKLHNRKCNIFCMEIFRWWHFYLVRSFPRAHIFFHIHILTYITLNSSCARCKHFESIIL